MDKLLWSWWSWLWNDQTSSSITTTAVPTAATQLLEKIKKIARTTTIPINATAKFYNSSLNNGTTTATIPDSLIAKTLKTLATIKTSTPSTTLSETDTLYSTVSNQLPSLSSIFPSSLSSSSLTSDSTSTLTATTSLVLSTTQNQFEQEQENATTSLPLSSAFSTILDYDSFYGSSSEILSNFSIPVSSVNFSDVLVSDISGVNSVVSDEFLLDLLWNCSSLNGCCFYNNRTSSITAVALGRNGTSNCTEDIVAGYTDFESALHLLVIFSTAIVLGVIILATVIGNVFVIAAILLERNLQSVANYLILSLAVADLLVACLVMPLSAVYEVSNEWKLGPELCDMWTSSDVLCCTASILHLVAIALDRYWAVTNIDYIHQRTARRIGVMILVIWALSFLVSIAPLLGWKDPKWDDRVSIDRQCIVSQDVGYQIFATASSFYLPLLVILVLYWRIFQTARKRIRRRQQAAQTHPEPLAKSSCLALTAIGFRWKVTATQPTSGGLIATAAGGSGGIAAAVVTVIGRPLPTISETTTAFTNISSAHTSPEKGSYGNGVDRIENDPPTADISTYGTSTAGTRPTFTRKKTQTSVDSKRERKAAKTLAIITGAFVCCWLPFFILAILLPTCQCDISPLAMSLSLWLGYFNSTLNPIIYTIFSPEFRHAFKRILCGRRNSIRRRTRCVRR